MGARRVLTLSLVSLLSACSSTGPTPSEGARPESVLIDFHAAGKWTAHCTGTLISPNVVLTSGHCADGSTGARVTAPDARGQTSSALVVETYDWPLDDPKVDRSRANDLALVVLRSPIAVRHYAVIQSSPCEGCNVVQVARRSGAIQMAHGTRLSSVAPAGKPYQLWVPSALTDSGGALLRPSASGRPVVVGVISGVGAQSKAGYVARVSAPPVQQWMRDVVASAATRLAATTGSSTTKGLGVHLLDDPTGDPTPTGNDGSPAPDPVQPAQDDPPAQDGADAWAPDTPDPTAPNEPVVGGQPSNETNTNLPGDSLVPPGNAWATQEIVPGYAKTAEVNCSLFSNTTGGASGSDTGDVMNCQEAGAKIERTDNSWTKFKPDDPAGQGVQDYADAMAGTAQVIGAHGYFANGMWGVPDPSIVQTMGATGQPIVLASCFAGRGTPLEDNQSNAQRLADTSGVDRNQIYGCTGLAYPVGNEIWCDGTWKNGNGVDARPPGTGLRNCAGLQLKADDMHSLANPCETPEHPTGTAACNASYQTNPAAAYGCGDPS